MLSTSLDDVLTKINASVADLKEIDVLVLPENLGDEPSEFRDNDEAIWLSKYLKEENVALKTAYDFGLNPQVVDRRGIDIWLGVVWILNKIAAPVITAKLTAYLVKKGGKGADSNVHIDLRLQDGEKSSRLKYSGSIDDFAKLMEGLSHTKDKLLP